MKNIFFGFVIIIILIQFIPYGKNHNNPIVESEPKWDSNQTKALFNKACIDCHSHNTKWPWYSNIAPISWMVQYHVNEGREHFNVSMWGIQEENEGEEAVEAVTEGEMPLISYILAHPEAKLSKREKSLLIQGLKNTFGEDHKNDHD